MTEGNEKMSEVKPVAWVIEAGDGGRFLSFNDPSMGEPNGESLAPLYTADQLAEAVAAERERIAAIWDAKANSALECMKSSGKDGRHFQQIYRDCLEIATTIRSATK